MARKRFHHACSSASFPGVSVLMHSHQSMLLSIPIKLVAAEAGFLPPGPLTLLADIALGLKVYPLLYTVCSYHTGQ